jgi:photosystem II protein PsbQ
MGWTRSIVTVLLVAIASLVVGCSSGPVAVEPAYTPQEVAQIERYSGEVVELRDRFTAAIPPMIANETWRDVETFIHGPLGELRAKMASLTRALPPERQTRSLQAARDVFGHLVALDNAARARDTAKAVVNYNGALEDFKLFLDQVPTDLPVVDQPAA